ncbi:MAG TPA: VOC family protein, partial [Deinococcales bacterium]|nr:VOC family protein [Deinococcales bacterium]
RGRWRMPVTGIGGFFFRAQDPDALGRWYRERLGVTLDGGEPWRQQAGPTVVQPFPEQTDYLPAGHSWMLNLRVTGLDDLLAALRRAGVEVQTDPAWDTPETGRFARIHDPEGNPIELWEPPEE